MRMHLVFAGMLAGYLLLLLIAFRIAIPALVNMQNDGALILAILLAFALAALPFFVCFLMEKNDED